MAAAAGGVDRNSSIQVAVRVRPFTIQEAAQLTKTDDGPLFLGDGSLAAAPKPKLGQKGLRSVIKVIDDKCLVFDPPEDNPVQRFSRSVVPTGKRVKDQTFGFDRVFDENTTQNDVYEGTTKGLLDSVLDGFNCTVFAYGATGCGKTHTITGTAQQPGIIFMTMQELFEKIDDVRETKDCEITMSYLEIYNEKIRDLLSLDETGKPNLMLREDNNQVVSVAGLSSHKPKNVAEVMDIVLRGNANRTQSPTEANATSSRSHAVLQVNVSLKDRNASVNEPVTFATLSIIDLAGSERASATKNRGVRLQEGANINKSLLALGSCINALCELRKHIPFRNSTLTRLLKFSLGGNCRTVMIVCVSPSSAHFDETQNTLRYANRAKNIRTKSVRNVYNVDRHVKDYLKKIDEQMELIRALTEQQKDSENIAFTKFRKAESKKSEIAHDGVQRIRAAYDHSSQERNERITNTKRLRQIERRIGAISGWVGSFDQVCETREEEEPPVALIAMRKTAQGILLELEGSRQHYHQRLAKNNWTRAIDTALQEGIRQLQNLDGAAPDSAEETNLRKEVELLKSRADVDLHMQVLEQEKVGESGLMQVMLTAHFETISILNQIMQMSEEEAVQAARDVLGKVLQACTEATGQIIKPDGGLQIVEAVPPTRSGTPKKKKQIPLMGPSPMKTKIRQSLPPQPAPSAIPSHLSAEMQSSPHVGSSPVRGATASPRRRVKLGGTARKGVAFAGGTPKKKSPSKKRVVRWKDEDANAGALVEFQPTPKKFDSTPPQPDGIDSDANDPPRSSLAYDADGEIMSSPLPVAPIPSSEARKPGTGRFAAGFLSKKNEGSPPMPPPTLSLGAYSSEDESSPLRSMEGNRAPQPRSIHTKKSTRPPAPASGSEKEQDSGSQYSSGSEVDKSFADKETARGIGAAMRKGRRTSSLGGNTSARQRERDIAHHRRSPTAASPPSDQATFSDSHARRFVNGHRDTSSRNSILSPRTQPVTKGSLPLTARRSMFDLGGGTPRETAPRPASRASSVVPGSATRGSAVKPPFR
ncbi:hypothetical protein PRZ48_005368 [Zasmidium cellare]|uniref:Kinesin motor domain-containing protein n=1 Tax=Zasmidium cellare TaxID=395010 RepID=A0ABR0ES78_ZASCE|nr:hypothetical protein PRZ48_005368 [Zasmidium cellare]